MVLAEALASPSKLATPTVFFNAVSDLYPVLNRNALDREEIVNIAKSLNNRTDLIAELKIVRRFTRLEDVYPVSSKSSPQ
jgi:hypothetical protein